MRPDTRGVSSVISVLRIKPERYTTLLKFFRSTSFDIDGLYQKLITVFLKILPPKTVDGRVILAGDHIKISKEGRGMPAIEKLHQESQNSGKGAFIEGHLFGFTSMIIPAITGAFRLWRGYRRARERPVERALWNRWSNRRGCSLLFASTSNSCPVPSSTP
jgi:hypothetical protein